jgi:hypothetical protein
MDRLFALEIVDSRRDTEVIVIGEWLAPSSEFLLLACVHNRSFARSNPSILEIS